MWGQIILGSLLLLLSPPPTHQVSITLSWQGQMDVFSYDPVMNTYIDVICTNIQPGRCCKPARFTPNPYGFPREPQYRVAEITGLQPLDIASVWKPWNGQNGCAGIPGDTKVGPGNWYYPDQNAYNHRWTYFRANWNNDEPTGPGSNTDYISGASYISVPTKLPVNNEAAPWLEAEGIIGLAWGDGKWFSSKASASLQSSLLGTFFSRFGSQRLMKREEWKRGIRSPLKGEVFAQPPGSYVWPDTIIINGTTYTENGSDDGNLTYVSATGQNFKMSTAE